MTLAARDSALVDTRISGREQRPRPLAAVEAVPGSDPPAKDQPAPTISRAERARRARYLRQLEAERREAELKKQLPAYIHACFNNPDRKRTYWVYTWKPDNPDSKKRIPYTCGSWKCEHCREHAGHVLFARLQQAFHGLNPRDVVFIVLTLDPDFHREAKRDLDGVYREFTQRQNRWTKRLRRYLVQRFGSDMANRWASVTECHKSGVPHVNIAVHHPAWARELASEREWKRTAKLSEWEQIAMGGELARHAQECGFGWRCSAEANRYGNVEAITGYLVKGVKQADAMHAEIAKLTQLPTMAPKNFRRLRAGKGFVPPKEKGECTGTVIRRYWTPEGDEQTEPLSKPRIGAEPDRIDEPEAWALWDAERARKLAYLAEVEHCIAIEQVLAWEAEGFRGPAVTVPKGDREELITAFTRRLDGATVRAGMVVLNAPRSTLGEQQHGKEEWQSTGTSGDGRDGRGGTPRGDPADGCGDVHPQPIRIPEATASPVQLDFDACRRAGHAGGV